MATTHRHWLIRPIVLLGVLVALVMVWTGGSASNASEDERARDRDGPVSRASLPLISALAGSANGLDGTEARPVLRLEGRVVDVEEHGIGGARVTLGGGRAVESEADGSFAFDGVMAGTYDVVAEHGDQYAETQGVQLDETSEPVILTLVRGPTLVVHVTDAHGPIAGATVDLMPRTFVTGIEGTARIRGVAIEEEYVIVSAKGHARVRERIPTGDDPAATIEWTVVLAAGAEVAGTVVDQDGKPVPEAYVEIEAAGRKHGGTTFTDQTGRWHVPDVGAGKYVVRASSRQHIATADLALEHDGTHPTTGVVVHVEPGGEIAGIVVDTAGKPVADAKVTARSGSETTGADGRFVVRGLVPDKYEITASTQALGAASQEVTLARGQHVALKIVLVPSSIAGVVVDAHGEPVEDAAVFARSDAPNGYAFERTDAHGRFDLGGLPPGRYELTAQRSDSRVDSPAVGVTTGDRHVRLVVSDPAGVTGRVVLDGKPVPYYGVALSDDPSSTFDRPTPVRDPDGRFTERDVAPGMFAVIIVGPGFARRVVEGVRVVSGRVTDVGDIAVTRGDSVHGRVVDARGAGVAGATVRIAGSSFSSGDTGLRAIMQGDCSAITDAGGYYAIAGQDAKAEDRQIEAVHPEYGRSGIHVLAPGETEVDLVLAATGSIEGTIVRPRRDMHLVIASRVGDRQSQYHADLTDAGAFRFPQLPPGEYDVRVLGSHARPSAHVTVTAGASTAVTFELPENPVELRVHIAGGCSLVSLRTTVSDELVQLESCTEGRATMPDLAPGPYQLCVELSDCRPIDVPAMPVYALEVAR